MIEVIAEVCIVIFVLVVIACVADYTFSPKPLTREDKEEIKENVDFSRHILREVSRQVEFEEKGWKKTRAKMRLLYAEALIEESEKCLLKNTLRSWNRADENMEDLLRLFKKIEHTFTTS